MCICIHRCKKTQTTMSSSNMFQSTKDIIPFHEIYHSLQSNNHVQQRKSSISKSRNKYRKRCDKQITILRENHSAPCETKEENIDVKRKRKMEMQIDNEIVKSMAKLKRLTSALKVLLSMYPILKTEFKVDINNVKKEISKNNIQLSL